MKVLSILLLAVGMEMALGQVPPRLQIPGAVLVGGAPPRPPSGFRQARVQQPPPEAVAPRIRRPPPNAIPLPIRPVVEEPEELPLNSPRPSTFDDEVTKLGLNALQNAVRQAEEEPVLTTQVQFRPERPVLREPIPARPILREPARPAPRQRQRQEELVVPQSHRQQARPHEEHRQQTRPLVTPNHAHQQTYDEETRERKPVVQILRKYRTDNPDGSITWGYENEDGSFKEETLGIDCVTKGKYGYVDPDGVRREYSYETGNKCDQPEEEELEDLPVGKPQARKPSPQFRPQAQPAY